MSADSKALQSLFRRIQRGMTMDEVRLTLGDPGDTVPLTFGGELLTTWVYHAETGPAHIWFDENDRVKMKSVQ